MIVGTERGLEARLVPQAGLPLETIRAAGLKGIGGAKFVRNAALLPLGMWDSAAILQRHHFAAAFGVGGYASGPMMLLATLNSIPTVVFEPNVEPGFTNRVLANMATRVAVAYRETAEKLGRRAILTGCPVRAEFFSVPRKGASSAIYDPDYGRKPGRTADQPCRCGLARPLSSTKKSAFHRASDRRTRL